MGRPTPGRSLDGRVRAAIGTKVPGVALVVVGPEGVRARSAVGLADVNAKDPMTTELAMPWFSMTKIATATAAISLTEGGLLSLDSRLLPLVSQMHSLRPSEWAALITPRHVLQHSSGLANPIPVRWVHPADKPGPDPDRFLEHLLAKRRKLRSEPGTVSRYSNLGPLVLGAAMAKVAGSPFTDVVTDRVLKPLGMSATGFTFPDRRPAATGYHPRRSPMRLLLPRWVMGQASGPWIGLRRFLIDGTAYGGLVGTPEDAARFLQMHIRAGELDGSRIIAAESAADMRRIDKTGKDLDLGLGWFVPSDRRNADPGFVEHLGGGAGFYNVMRLYPSAGVGAVVMGNATNYDVDAVAALALEFL